MLVRSIAASIVLLAFTATSSAYEDNPKPTSDKTADMTRDERDAMWKKKYLEEKARREQQAEAAGEQVDDAEYEGKGKGKKGKAWKKEKAAKDADRAYDKKNKKVGKGTGKSGKKDGGTYDKAAKEKAYKTPDKARGDDMKARRDQRKEIMQEAKSTKGPGTAPKGKKPWWRFWDSGK